MQDFRSLASTLQSSLTLTQPPVAVTFADVVPDGIPRFDGHVPAGCSFWEKGAAGPIATSAADHALCAIGVYTHNLENPVPQHAAELQDVLSVLGKLEYVRSEDLAWVPVLNRSAKHVLYAPLAGVSTAPDAVLLFARVAPSLIIAEAVQQVEMGMPPAMGRPACAAVPQAVNSSRAAVSLGCCGARAYLDGFADDVQMWVLPGARLSEYVARIASLAGANATLAQFHRIRRQDIEAGGAPTYAESMQRLQHS